MNYAFKKQFADSYNILKGVENIGDFTSTGSVFIWNKSLSRSERVLLDNKVLFLKGAASQRTAGEPVIFTSPPGDGRIDILEMNGALLTLGTPDTNDERTIIWKTCV